MLTQLELSVKDSETSLLAVLLLASLLKSLLAGLLLAREMLLLPPKVDEKALPRREAFSAKLTGERLGGCVWKFPFVFCT